AGLFALGVFLAKIIFQAYLSHALDRYHWVYGSLAALIVAVLWVYYLSLIFVFCAHLVAILANPTPAKGKKQISPTEPDY
ncbi:MAG: YihY/virulence factor BrkB family protein, partial [Deltaproteobacteria bacterium]|nr:YihY/virulence factor BrkB family protein [Deltaproteobacteria bacterium]